MQTQVAEPFQVPNEHRVHYHTICKHKEGQFVSLRFLLIGYQQQINELDSVVTHWPGKGFPQLGALIAILGKDPRNR